VFLAFYLLVGVRYYPVFFFVSRQLVLFAPRHLSLSVSYAASIVQTTSSILLPFKGNSPSITMSSFQSSPQPHQGNAVPSRQFAAYNPVAAATAPAGTFLPGTKVQVGSHRVVVEKYLSEGGFAHVYVVRPPKPIDGAETAVLKRVAVPDKSALANMRTEVETMKKVTGIS